MIAERAKNRIYIIHSWADKELVRVIERSLRAAGLEPFGVGDHVLAGGELKEGIRDQLLMADAVLAIITPAALKSSWVMAELGMAEGFDLPIIPVTAGLDSRALSGPLVYYPSVPFDQLDTAIGELARTLSGPLAS